MKRLPFRVRTKGNFPRSQIQLTWQNSKQTLSTKISQRIEDYWQQEILPSPQGQYVFNGQLCSLHNWQKENSILSLELGRTDYKTLLYSNFVNRNSETHGNFICNAFGISVVIVSADDQLVLMQRSHQVGECAGMIDVAQVTDDLGSQTGPLISLETYQEFYAPHHQRFIDLCHEFGIKVFHHNDGSCRLFLPLLVEMGIDVLNPIQWTCPEMDMLELKAESKLNSVDSPE